MSLVTAVSDLFYVTIVTAAPYTGEECKAIKNFSEED